MEHGRDHQERQQKARPSRTNNTPQEADPEGELEAQLLDTKRGGEVPAQGVIGAHLERPGYSSAEGQDSGGDGSNTAPTDRARQREGERHRLEEQLGHIPAGIEGVPRAVNLSRVTREGLDDAAQQADAAVAGAAQPRARA